MKKLVYDYKISETEEEKEFKRKFEYEIEVLRRRLYRRVNGRTVDSIASYMDSTDASLKLFKWWLMKKILSSVDNRIRESDFKTSEGLDWILSNREVLEMLMTSGEVYNDNYVPVLQIMADLLKEDPLIKKKPLRLRLAVACALTGAGGARQAVLVSVPKKRIDVKAIYRDHVEVAERGEYLKPFYKLTTWQLRYVVTTYQTPEEQVWARENTDEKYKDPSKLDTVWRLVPYHSSGRNKDGGNVHAGQVFYYYLPITLKTLLHIGGVCGAVTRYLTGITHAFGMPSAQVGQPGHSGSIWLRNGTEWVMAYMSGTWDSGLVKPFVQNPWKRSDKPYYFPMMNDAQMHLKDYILSEKMRIASRIAESGDRLPILEYALMKCDSNLEVWVDLMNAMDEPGISKERVHDTLLPAITAYREEHFSGRKVDFIGVGKKITSECFGESARNMLLVSKNWLTVCRQKTAEIEIDLGKPYTVTELKIQWWGVGKAQEYDIYAMSEEGKYVLVKTQNDETVEGWWHPWSYLTGWEMKTTKIKVELREGKLQKKDIWFGLWKFTIMGYGTEDKRDISLEGNQVTANAGSSDPASLVDDNSGTVWHGKNDRHSWFEIDLKKICFLDYIEMEWTSKQKPDKVEVKCKCGSGSETKVSADEKSDKCCTKMKVEIYGQAPEIRGIKVHGADYGSKDIMALRIKDRFADFPPDFGKGGRHWIQRDLLQMLDEVAYED